MPSRLGKHLVHSLLHLHHLSSPSAVSSSDHHFQYSDALSPSPMESSPSPQSPRSDKVQPPSTIVLDTLHGYLSKCKSNPSILALVKDYSSSFVPKSLPPALPSLLSELYNSGFLSASYSELLTLAADVNISVTPAQRTAVEECTRDQSKSHLWFNMRTGRVTASKLRAVCVTDETMSESISDDENAVYCYCQGPEMVE